ncbi:MAG: hypothetical protein AB1801_09420 [Chloroflexota bacterium]
MGSSCDKIEAVYHYILESPRIRFLIADDPGADKRYRLTAANTFSNQVVERSWFMPTQLFLHGDSRSGADHSGPMGRLSPPT